jgi:hypothetical protein
MPKTSTILLITCATLLGACKKNKERSLEGAIDEADQKAIPSKKQCDDYAEQVVKDMPAANAKFMQSSTSSICLNQYTVATLKCAREQRSVGSGSARVGVQPADPYGCVTKYPKKK